MTESVLMGLLTRPLFTFVAGLIVGSLFTAIVMHFFNRKSLPAKESGEAAESEETVAPYGAAQDNEQTVAPYGAVQDDDKTIAHYGGALDDEATNDPYAGSVVGKAAAVFSSPVQDDEATVNPYVGFADSEATVAPYGAVQDGEVTVNPYAPQAFSAAESPSNASFYDEEEATVNPYAAKWPTGIRVGIKVETPRITYARVWNVEGSLQAGGEEDGLDLDVENTSLCRVMFTRRGTSLFAAGKPGENDAQPVLLNGERLGDAPVQVNIADVFEFEGIRLTIESMG